MSFVAAPTVWSLAFTLCKIGRATGLASHVVVTALSADYAEGFDSNAKCGRQFYDLRPVRPESATLDFSHVRGRHVGPPRQLGARPTTFLSKPTKPLHFRILPRARPRPSPDLSFPSVTATRTLGGHRRRGQSRRIKAGRAHPPVPRDYAAGFWWRFEAYRLKDGCIRPARGAELICYDPWWDFYRQRTERGHRRPTEAPYAPLLRLVEQLGLPNSQGHVLSGDHQELLLDWCATHGLLGLALHKTRFVLLAPRWMPSTLGKTAATDPVVQRELERMAKIRKGRFGARVAALMRSAGSGRRRKLVAIQRQYSRLYDGEWTAYDNPLLALRPGEERVRKGELVEKQRIEEAYRPRVGGFDLGSGRWIEEPLSMPAAWASYFPTVPPDQWHSFQYPQPLTERFWHLYAEPVENFLQAAFILYAAAKGTSFPPRRRATRAEETASPASAPPSISAEYGLGTLNQLVAGVSPRALRFPDGTVQQRWVAPSLLAAYAMMALQDQIRHRVQRCASCGEVFQPESTRALYCSPTCRWREQRRTQRAARVRPKKRTTRT